MVILPYDIWLNISTFLPGDALWKLRGLNRAFFDIAMDIRYKRVEIPMRFTKIKGYSRHFLRFRDGIANRVQEIAYYPSAKTVFPPKKGSKMVQKLSSVKQLLDSIGVGDQALMKETIKAFTDVKSLSIQFSRIAEETLQECIPLFHINFCISSDSLRKLELSLPHNKISAILPSDLYLPHLDTLSLVFSTSTDGAELDYQPSFRDTANNTIAPFVNNHRKTLVSVDFRIYGFTETWPPMITVFATSHLFHKIKHITHLRSISVCLSQSDSFESVAHFIRDHSETIQTLRIYLVVGFLSPNKLFDHIGERSFPNLSALAIPECKDDFLLQDHGSRPTTTSFIHRCSSSLTSLNLTHTKYSRDGIFHLLNPAGDTPFSFSAMVSLHIRLCFFTVDLMDLFVNHLPSLHELDLVIEKLLDQDTMLLKDRRDNEFCLDMSHRDYSHWSLKHFNIIITEGRYTFRRPTDEAGALLVRALPSLITFCRVERASYLVRAPWQGDHCSVVSI